MKVNTLKLTLGIGDNGPGNSNTLFLATRKQETTFANVGLVSFREAANEIMSIGLLRRFDDKFFLPVFALVLVLGTD